MPNIFPKDIFWNIHYEDFVRLFSKFSHLKHLTTLWGTWYQFSYSKNLKPKFLDIKLYSKDKWICKCWRYEVKASSLLLPPFLLLSTNLALQNSLTLRNNFGLSTKHYISILKTAHFSGERTYFLLCGRCTYIIYIWNADLTS